MRTPTLVLMFMLSLAGCVTKPAKELPSDSSRIDTALAQALASRAPSPRPGTPSSPATEPDEALDLWQRVSRDSSWPVPHNDMVHREIALLTRWPRHLTRVSAHAEPFLWYIVEALRERDLPIELALIPMIESGFRNQARSPYGAVGLWQFMPRTGRRFGLRQTPYYDARADVSAATSAALDYLTKLHDQFDHDWLLAVAAYNCGPAALRRAREKSSGSDFWSIAEHLPAETRRHVPRLVAAVHIVRNPALYQVALHPIANSPFFKEIDLGKPFDLGLVRDLAGFDAQWFDPLNAAFKQRYSDPRGPFKILIPIDSERSFERAIENLPRRDPARTNRHIVRAGETLSEIAEQYGVGLDELRTQNRIRKNLINVGQELVVPRQFAPAVDPLNDGAITQHHVVEEGESLWTIAQRFSVTVKHLRSWNKIRRRAYLHPGQRLIVSRPSTHPTHGI